MTANAPRSRPPDEDVVDLPPIDGDDEPPSSDAPEAVALREIPAGEDALDDRAADDLDVGADLVDAPGSKWVGEHDDAGDLDVGADDEELLRAPLDDVAAHEDDVGASVDAADGLVLDEFDAGEAHDDAEGPLGDVIEAFDERPRSPADSADELADAVGDHGELPHDAGRDDMEAFALPFSSLGAAQILTLPIATLACAVDGGRVVFAGDGICLWSSARSEPSAPRAIRVETSEWLTSVVSLGERSWLAGSMEGRVVRSDDDGERWETIASLGASDGGRATLDLHAERRESGVRVWARAHGGALFRSDDSGRTWEGPVLTQAVRAFGVDALGGGALAATVGWNCELLHTRDGREWRAKNAHVSRPPDALLCRGDAWLLAFADAPGRVSVDAGETWTDWPLLRGASALTWLDADDGAVQLLAAIADEAADRSTVVAAAIDRTGAARAVRRVADVQTLLRPVADVVGDDFECRVDALVPLDGPGRRIVAVTPRGALVLSLDADDPPIRLPA